MTLAVDFDRVIHDTDHPIEGKRMGKPLPGAVDALESLVEHGNTVIVHTVMAASPSGAKAVSDWLEYYDIPHHGVTAIKPRADYYIDDKAVHHIDWPSTLQAIGFEED